MKFNKKLFYIQFVCIAIWLVVLYLHFISAMKGKLISIIFIILGIIFLIFHFTVIMNYKDEKRIDKKIEELEKNLKDLTDDLNGNV